uniref:SSD domain-containing protein n=1 Tax=Romanomermis culicivorax TaxID=13658 RepID=A0A915IT94_ROMCU
MVPILLTLSMIAPIFMITADLDIILLFTPARAPSRREQQTFRQFSRMEASPQNFTNFESQISASKKNDKAQNFWWFNTQIMLQNESNIMTYKTWKAMYEVVNNFYENFTCEGIEEGRILKYMPDYCNPVGGCVRMDRYFNDVMEILPGGKLGNSSDVQLTYPMVNIHGKMKNWAELIFGATVDNQTGLLLEAKTVFLVLEFQFEINETMIRATKKCMHQLADYFHSMNGYHDLKFLPIFEELIQEELVKTKRYTLPYLTLTVFFVTIFSMISSLEKENVVISACAALIGVCTIGMALLTSFGFMYICGVYFNVMISITPFITMCVGIDNDFLLLSSWHHTNRKDPAYKRLGVAFAEACPSLAITSITDVLCFSIGMLIDTPAVSKFCLFTAITLGLRFAYQVTFFAAVLAYSGDLEKNGRCYDRYVVKRLQYILPESYSKMHLTSYPNNDKKSVKSKNKDHSCHLPNSKMQEYDHWAHNFFRHTWSRFLCRRKTKISTMLISVVYLLFSLYRACQIIVYIKPEKLIVDDSELLPALKFGEKYVVANSVIGHAFVLEPPDFRNQTSRKLMLDFLDALESTEYSAGPKTTNLWFRDYLDFLCFTYDCDDYVEEFYIDIPKFLSTGDWKQYYSDFRFKTANKNGDPMIEKFKFRLYFNKNVDTWEKRVDLMMTWRKVCEKFNSLNALVFDHTNLNPYYDQWRTLAPTNAETTGIAVICMALVTALLMPDLASVFFITISFISVDIGVIGFLQVFQADIDPITVACILMTIGFSIYYTARVCYCYQMTDKRLTPEQKLCVTMGLVGWPIVQGGLSTFLGVLPLLLVKSYMVRLFFKTITLIVCAGFLHGLLFVPVLMICLDKSAKDWKRNDKLRLLAGFLGHYVDRTI